MHIHDDRYQLIVVVVHRDPLHACASAYSIMTSHVYMGKLSKKEKFIKGSTESARLWAIYRTRKMLVQKHVYYAKLYKDYLEHSICASLELQEEEQRRLVNPLLKLGQ